jgi:predicted short-subunit dehydrogenase-like oxidoreductase (DUF2520 family)
MEYAIIGCGRLAGHLAFYLSSLSIAFTCWGRRTPGRDCLADTYEPNLERAIEGASHVLVVISDDAIERFLAENHTLLADKICVHCSGSLVTALAQGAHPLMTFTEELYPVDHYRRIPFVVERGERAFEELLPGLPNPHYYLEAAEKPLYHALCVLSGNFTSLLWEKVFGEFEGKLRLPREVAYPYLERICLNLMNSRVNPVTGPLVRRDRGTVERNLEALGEDPYRSVYEGFLKALGLGEWSRGD